MKQLFVSSKAAVFEKIEEPLRHCKGVEDVNHDEIMELCILSNEFSACETTTILNPLRFMSHAARLGLREGFTEDLTAVRAKGTVWDFSLEDDKTELRRLRRGE